ncbi:hypothetical protein HM1_0768 [Heliomicrobium modesticaldum Ice1]|uniref:Uncharacterized protein n=1 Tax=Heliobacterium modesticaldum (strain ATCC 51547 / Ice1) TaxID=498761 RepID=B0TB61_HELMI|nr:hypothetical protein HM1_0768 [Heliomicrobium modesticaldum Ice1]
MAPLDSVYRKPKSLLTHPMDTSKGFFPFFGTLQSSDTITSVDGREERGIYLAAIGKPEQVTPR